MIYSISRPHITGSISLLVPVLQGGGNLLQGFAVLFLAIIISISLIAFILVVSILFPYATHRSKEMFNHFNKRSFFVGLVNYIFLGGIAMVLFSAGEDVFSFIGLFILGILIAVTAVGLSGLVSLVGAKLSDMHSQELSPLAQLVWGSAALILAGVFPFIGWFLLTPLIMLTAFGAALLGWRNRKRDENLMTADRRPPTADY